MNDDLFQTALRESGENLASIAERYVSGAASAEEFLLAARRHMVDLAHAALPEQAFGTAVMSLLTALRRGLDPESISGTYLLVLMGAAMFCVQSQAKFEAEGDAFASEHFAAMQADLGTLLYNTYRNLGPEANLPDGARAMLDSLSEWVDAERKFQGQPITRYSVADILYDCAARCAAMGLME